MERESKAPYWPNEELTSTPEGLDDLTEAEDLEISKLVNAGHSSAEADELLLKGEKSGMKRF